MADLPFHVVTQKEIPEELLQIIEKKKEGAFHLTYEDGGTLYIVVGYGAMDTADTALKYPASI